MSNYCNKSLKILLYFKAKDQLNLSKKKFNMMHIYHYFNNWLTMPFFYFKISTRTIFIIFCHFSAINSSRKIRFFQNSLLYLTFHDFSQNFDRNSRHNYSMGIQMSDRLLKAFFLEGAWQDGQVVVFLKVPTVTKHLERLQEHIYTKNFCIKFNISNPFEAK